MRSSRLIALCLAIATMLALGVGTNAGAATGGPPQAKQPTFTPIGPVDSNVLSMSSDGTIAVGDFIFGGGAFMWKQGQGTTMLGDAGGQISISRDGSTIVGDTPRHGHLTASVWRGGTQWKSLGGYAGSQGCPDLSDAYAVSNRGKTVVGLGWDGCKASAFRWTKGTGMVSLGTLDGQASRADDISADGSVIVGWDDSPIGERRGAMWVNGTERLLSPSGTFVGEAEAVSANGRVVVGGNAGKGQFRRQAYRWTANKGVTLLGRFRGSGSGPWGIADALGVTDNGRVIVGFSGGRRRTAFIWSRSTGMMKLEDYLRSLGVTGFKKWRLDTATAISGDGSTIAGWGYRPDGHVQSWIVRNLPPLG
jgi:probable HAF family extracellular repeat protein